MEDVLNKVDQTTADQLAKEAKAAYMREYRKKNPDRMRTIDKRYWARRALRVQEDRNEEE